ncbi:MAG: carbohydrate-binding protein [Bacteroidota bacterium]
MHEENVFVEPVRPERKERARIGYDGLLVKSGADRVFLHYGFDGWKNPRTVPMSRFMNGFVASIPIEGVEAVDFCFRDSAGNWDNNSGWNWKAPIE